MFEPTAPGNILRVPYPEHPNRCQQVIGGNRQCFNISVENGSKCIVHGGHKELESQRNQSLRMYRLGQWQARANELLEHPNIKSLREEIGILRILLEERFAQCQNDSFSLLLQAGPISDLILKIEKVVSSCHRLEASMGEHIEKSQLLLFASEIVAIIGEVLVDDQEKLDIISFKILDLVNKNG
jgi:hypothetical protein